MVSSDWTTDQQPLGLARQQNRRYGQHQTDQDRGDAIEDRQVKAQRKESAGKGDQQAEQRRAILEQNHEGGRILAGLDRRENFGIVFVTLETAQGQQPCPAVEQSRQSQHEIIGGNVVDAYGMQYMNDALEKRDAGAQSENLHGDDKAPEIDFAAEAEGMIGVGRPL